MLRTRHSLSCYNGHEVREVVWSVFSIVGTIAFAISGALVAMEEEYDILGVFVLAFATAFGGGAIRNVLVGIPLTDIWNQSTLFTIAVVATAITFLSPVQWIQRWERWESYFDAVGLSAFAIQGALYAERANHALSAVIVAAVMTGIGGGMIRDIFAGRKPLVLREEIYALWAGVAGLVIGLGWVRRPWELYVMFVMIAFLRMLSIRFRWKLPSRSLKRHQV